MRSCSNGRFSYFFTDNIERIFTVVNRLTGLRGRIYSFSSFAAAGMGSSAAERFSTLIASEMLFSMASLP